MIREIDYKAFKPIYKTHLVADFPSSERRPLSAIRRMFNSGNYRVLIWEEDGKMLAYASFVCDESMDGVLLDNYAVNSDQRGSGIGSRFLAAMCEYWHTNGMLIECESPESAKEEKERITREKRIAFYLRNGARKTDCVWEAFGVDFKLLYLPVEGEITDAMVGRRVAALYRIALPGLVFRKYTKLTLPEEILD